MWHLDFSEGIWEEEEWASTCPFAASLIREAQAENILAKRLVILWKGEWGEEEREAWPNLWRGHGFGDLHTLIEEHDFSPGVLFIKTC
jgi:hypothetical protein